MLPLGNRPANIDEVIGDHAESDPAPHPVIALIQASVESVPPLEHADASFASRPPFLSSLKPAFLLLTLERGALGGTARNGNTFHSILLRLGYILGRIESGIARNQMRQAACALLME